MTAGGYLVASRLLSIRRNRKNENMFSGALPLCVAVCVEGSGIPLGDFGRLDTWLQREKAC